ncbi:MAG: EscR/YscR/HrcR family type III secretion system export apparatus protein [Deltaproteobacteria bacterium CG_4_10_14_0_2_um_filter_43_8]|nr:MAG: EscR/YscR/HrcR family type III secretion system export apparatus protein [Deltaproteobacteria bacterium CG11_big_fil_rev_8_21_14_0_20_42_23]PJA19595.1 MAG: EscR/YscR/HrcR family type III secretion system export apparatus protein [Deltaproteobacteria bacterium CG_4_10_14_0_2_um_filter_43_8]PJC64030.1 MAG: EscR/YscR/HrcR family type III secretion system export apparatus protein [Deltaproteobacteria bacterium CG_4_9_14_0_2_um_filter_42_21]
MPKQTTLLRTSAIERKGKRKKLFLSLFVALFGVGISSVAYAQTANAGVSKPLILLLTLAALSVVPFLVMLVTSFVKIAVVLSLIRSAIGTQQVPPNIIITGLSLILTIYIMVPVGLEIYKAAGDVINRGTNQPLLSQASVKLLQEGASKAKEPLRAFLIKHVHEGEKSLFYNLALKLRTTDEERKEISSDDFINLVPAFVISELSEAFQIGFIIFLPFLVIDLVIANILLSLGMFQISPVTISLPFKLLLFVLVDGWLLITKGLVLGYV